MSNMPANMRGRAIWTVIGAVQTTDATPSGQYEKGWRVSYRLDTGHEGAVFVPGVTPNQDAVRDAITQAADALYTVVNLSSGG